MLNCDVLGLITARDIKMCAHKFTFVAQFDAVKENSQRHSFLSGKNLELRPRCSVSFLTRERLPKSGLTFEEMMRNIYGQLINK